MAVRSGDAATRDALRSALVRLQEADEKASVDVLQELSFSPLDATGSGAGAAGAVERRVGGVAAFSDILGAGGVAVGIGMAPVDMPADRLALSAAFGSFAGVGGAGGGGNAGKDGAARQAHKANLMLQGLYMGTVDKTK